MNTSTFSGAIPALILCLVSVLGTAAVFISYFRSDGGWNPGRGIRSLRYFTTLSNLMAALSSAMVLPALARAAAAPGAAAASGEALSAVLEISPGVMLFRFAAVCAVTVTLLTVVFFLGPSLGFAAMYRGSAFYMHLVGPLCAIASYCLLEKVCPVRLPATLAGMLPLCLYAAVYLREVIFVGEGRGGWPDFYGFDRDGRWRTSAVIMHAAALAVAFAVAAAHNAGI